MRLMLPEEMEEMLRRCLWASICTVSEDGKPYAVEATPFFMGGDHCFMINPRGGTWRNLHHSSDVLLKYTFTENGLKRWAGLSCFGTGEFIKDADTMREGWRLLGKVMNTDYSRAAETFANKKDRSPLFRVRVESMTGRCSGLKGTPFFNNLTPPSAEDA